MRARVSCSSSAAGAGLEGQAADTLANIAKLRQAIAEQMQQIAQLDNDRMTEVAKDLRDTQAQAARGHPAADERQGRARAGWKSARPTPERVVGLNIFSVGGVIARGDKILDVVPDQDSLVVEAQIGVDDISDVHPDTRRRRAPDRLQATHHPDRARRRHPGLGRPPDRQ